MFGIGPVRLSKNQTTLNSSETLELALCARRIYESLTNQDHFFRCINRSHERILSKDRQVSLRGAAKLYQSYNSAKVVAEQQNRMIEEAQGKLLRLLATEEHGEADNAAATRASKIGAMLESAKGMLKEEEEEKEDEFNTLSPDITTSQISPARSMDMADTFPNEQSMMDRDQAMELDSVGEDYKKRTIPEKVITQTMDTKYDDIKAQQSEHRFSAGLLVAVLNTEASNEEWMLATIIAAEVDSCTVEDYDRALAESDGSTRQSAKMSAQAGDRQRYSVPFHRIKSLFPSDAVALESGELAAKSRVLALFPGTTCLYPATVITPPGRRRKHKNYLVRFDDDEESPSRTVQPRFVLAKHSL